MKNKKTIIRLCLVILASVNSMYAFSQTEKISGGFGAINFGISTVNVQNLNSTLETYGYPSFSEQYFTNSLQFGGSIYSIKRNFIYGIEGQGFTSRGINNASYNATLTGRMATIDFGYLLLRKETLLLYPLIGAGMDRINIRGIQKNTSKDFNAIVNPSSAGTGFDLYQGNIILNAAVAATYLIEATAIDDSKVHWLLGLKLGYRYNPQNNHWKVHGSAAKLYNGPDIGISGPYFQLIIGKGKFKRV